MSGRESGSNGRGADDGLAIRMLARLVRLYPRGFRDRYEAELIDAFREGWHEHRVRGRMRAAGFWVRTSASLMTAAGREWIEAGWTAGRVDTLAKTRRRSMLGTDIRYAVRFLQRNPAFSVAVALTLALGIGMNTAAFSVLYGALYAEYPYAAAERLVIIGRTHPQITDGLLPVSPGSYYDLAARLSAVELEAVADRTFVYGESEVAARYPGMAMTPGFFDMLGVVPAMGRAFRAGDDEPGAAPVAVVSDAFWRAQLGSDPGAVGRTIRLNDEPYLVIGVMPRDFEFSGGSVWTTLRLTQEQRARRDNNYLRMWARLRPGVTIERAASEAQAAWTPLREAFPRGNEDTGLTARSFRDVYTRSYRSRLAILLGAAAFVLLIACANVANLLLVRAERRQREVGVRAALGASSGRLARQFLTEGLLISILGGVLGLVVGWVAVRALVAAFGDAVPRATAIAINLPVLSFTLGASLVTGLLTGLAPALTPESRFDVLREGSRATARFSRLGGALVIAEVALAIMLVTGAGLLLKSYARATTADLGFDADNIVAATFWFPASRFPESSQSEAFLERLDATLRSDSRIQGHAMSNMVPVRDYGNNFTEVGAVGSDAEAAFVESRVVTPSFFDALLMQFVAGRTFTEAESRSPTADVIAINRTLAKQLFGDGDPLGRRIAVGRVTPEVIAVVDDLRDFGPDQVAHPTMYFAANVASNLIVRSPLGEAGITALLREHVGDIDSSVAVLKTESMESILTASLAGRRFQLTLLGIFAATALTLACVGIYGVLAYSVERQTREIGVRMALGARAPGVAWHVARRGGRLAMGGVMLGAFGTLALQRAIEAQLFEVDPFDPVVYGGVVAVLLSVAALACVIPARRAARIDPIRALREDA